MDWIRREGLAMADPPVLPHAKADDVRGHVAIGIMPLRIASAAELAIRVSLMLPRELVGGELTVEQLDEHFERVIRCRVIPADD